MTTVNEIRKNAFIKRLAKLLVKNRHISENSLLADFEGLLFKILLEKVQGKENVYQFRKCFEDVTTQNLLEELKNQGEIEGKTFRVFPDFGQMKRNTGFSDWPQITDDEVKRYLKLLTLAVSQPDEVDLVDHIKHNIELLVPFSQYSVDNIFGALEDKLKHWYKNNKGTWLNREHFLEWVKKASGQRDLPLINPLRTEIRKASQTQKKSEAITVPPRS